MTESMPIPAYLQQSDCSYRTFGTLSYDEGKDSWVIDAEPCVLELAKRLFPGCKTKTGVARFKANRRTNGDLNWLMLRYPLIIQERDRWDKSMQEAVDHVLKLEEILQSPQKVTPPSLFCGTLTTFQEEGLAFLLHNRRTLLADEMGLGKTVQALAFLSTVESFPTLLIVPPHLIRNWKREILRFIRPETPIGSNASLFQDPEEYVHIITGLKPYDLPPAGVYIIHYLLLRGWKNYLPGFGFKAVIFDEIQELRHRQTEKYSSASLVADNCTNVIGLSGTPIYNRGGEIWNVMNIIEFHCLGDYESFSREWCYGYGSDTVKDPALLGDYLKREGLLLRRLKDQVLTELPPKRRVVQEIDYDSGLYSQLIQGAVEKAMVYQHIKDFTEKGRAKREIENETRQATGIAKARHVALFVKMLLDAGEKVLLFAYHHAVHEIYMEELKEYGPVKITGKENGQQKDESERAFMEGRTPVCIISLRAAAGLNLQKANCVVFGELDWSPAIHSQGEDRAHRIGQQDSVLCYYMVCDSGTDEAIREALGLKVSQFIGLMGDKAETQEDRLIAESAAAEHMNRVIDKLRLMVKTKGAEACS